MDLKDILLFLILVTLLTYTFIPWEYKEGKFSKPSIKTITLWWLIFAALSAIVTYFTRLIIFFT
tara:strand:- start:209 stop:400 length:192 start_codon:yes stop_codon:yes gene_type:complete